MPGNNIIETTPIGKIKKPVNVPRSRSPAIIGLRRFCRPLPSRGPPSAVRRKVPYSCPAIIEKPEDSGESSGIFP